jgi:hypothetical protein
MGRKWVENPRQFWQHTALRNALSTAVGTGKSRQALRYGSGSIQATVAAPLRLLEGLRGSILSSTGAYESFVALIAVATAIAPA